MFTRVTYFIFSSRHVLSSHFLKTSRTQSYNVRQESFECPNATRFATSGDEKHQSLNDKFIKKTKKGDIAKTNDPHPPFCIYRSRLFLAAPPLLLFHTLAAALTDPQGHFSQQGLGQRGHSVGELTARRLSQ